MKSATLLVTQDENGEYGVIYTASLEALGKSQVNLLTNGLGVAHDLLEHRDLRKLHLYAEEIMAFGAMVFVRQPQYFPKYQRMEGGDFAQMIASSLFNEVITYEYRPSCIPWAFQQREFTHNSNGYRHTSKIATMIMTKMESPQQEKSAAWHHFNDNRQLFKRSHQNLLIEGYNRAQQRFRYQPIIAARTFAHVEAVAELFFERYWKELGNLDGIVLRLEYSAEEATLKIDDPEFAKAYDFAPLRVA